MARMDDGELVLEIEGATEQQLERGLRAARQYITRARVDVEDAMRSAALLDEREPGWVAISDLSDEDAENVMIVDEATCEALNAADAASCKLGIIPRALRTRNRPVVRDLFELVL